MSEREAAVPAGPRGGVSRLGVGRAPLPPAGRTGAGTAQHERRAADEGSRHHQRPSGSEHEPLYQVVVNHEEQYSIWAADREPPDGWRAGGFTGTRQDCLAHIAEVWTDLRPLSARAAREM